MKSLSICVHGEPGTGKSWFGASAPAPRLVLDAEGGSRFSPGVKTYWDPNTEAPPVPGTGRIDSESEMQELQWETCVVVLRDFSSMERAYQWLASGQHPFASVVIDSITELQKRVVDQISGVSQPTQAEWGAILRLMEDQVRKLRDLLFHTTKPLKCVVLIALSHLRDNRFRPFVKGALELTLPGFVDVIGCLTVETGADGQLARKMLIAPLGDVEAKDRTHSLTQHYGPVIENPDIVEMLKVIESQDNNQVQ
jgi:hypothetical protein